MLGTAWKNLGRDDQYEKVMWIAMKCLEGIMLTGDGTEHWPYLVTRSTDEYDLFSYLDKEVESKSLVTSSDRICDVLKSTEGSSVYFDVTSFFGRAL